MLSLGKHYGRSYSIVEPVTMLTLQPISSLHALCADGCRVKCEIEPAAFPFPKVTRSGHPT